MYICIIYLVGISSLMKLLWELFWDTVQPRVAEMMAHKALFLCLGAAVQLRAWVLRWVWGCGQEAGTCFSRRAHRLVFLHSIFPWLFKITSSSHMAGKVNCLWWNKKVISKNWAVFVLQPIYEPAFHKGPIQRGNVIARQLEVNRIVFDTVSLIRD